jgi:hypothetical protein
MKKVLSLVLALVLVLGMSTMAFSNAYQANLTGTITAGDDFKFSLLVTPKFITDVLNEDVTNFVVDATGAIPASGKYAPIYFDGPVDDVATDTDGMESGNVWFNFRLVTPVDVVGESRFVLNPIYSADANRRVLTLRTIAAGGSGASRFIPNNYRVSGINSIFGIDWVNHGHADGSFVGSNGGYIVLEGDSSAKFQLKPNNFTWERRDGTNSWVNATNEIHGGDFDLRSTDLRDIGVRRTNPVRTNGTIKDVKIDGTTVAIEAVKFFVNRDNGGIDGSMDLQLTFKNRTGGEARRLHFNIANVREFVSSTDDYVFLDDNVFVESDGFNRNVEMNVGHGMYVYKNLHNGQKVYCRATLELSAGDERMFIDYKELDMIYTMHHAGVISAGTGVEFRFDSDTFFVYDAAFNLIGTTAQRLPWSSKYYLTTAQVDLSGGSAGDGPSDLDAPPMGGGNAPANNYNPNTGA